METPPSRFTLDDLQAAAPRVLARLRAMADLPDYGTVAGQSVASLFWDELGLPISGPVNDIDVFVNRSLPRTMRGLDPLPASFDPITSKSPKVATSSHRTSVSTESASYEHVKFLAMRFTTRILRTYVVGLVNYTLIDNMRTAHASLGHADDVSQEIVEGFDLNLVSVGINLETGNASASPAFLEFLSAPTIKVQTCNTPSHTMMRLASKIGANQITGVSCNFDREMDMLSTAISCQRTQESAGLGVIDLFGSKYRSLHGRYAGVLPPIEHIPHMDDEHKIPGSDDPPQTIDLYRMLVPPPASSQNQWLVEGASKLRNFQASNLLYLSHFPLLYEIAHPDQSGLDPAQAAIRRQSMDELVALADTLDSEPLEGFDLASRALGLPVIQSPIKGLDEKDLFAFFFGQQAGKSQAQADAAAAAFERLDPMHRRLLLSLREGADTALQFDVDPAGGFAALAAAHGPLTFNSWAQIAANSQILTENENFDLPNTLVATIDSMGDKGSARLISMLDEYDGLSSHVFSSMADAVGKSRTHEFLDWLARKVAPTWPDISATPPSVVDGITRAWIAAARPLPSQVLDSVAGESAIKMFHRAVERDNASSRASLSPDCATQAPAPEQRVLTADGRSLFARSMDALTLQDILAHHEDLAFFALKNDCFCDLLEHVVANPASRLDLSDIKVLRSRLDECASRQIKSLPGTPQFFMPDIDPGTLTRAGALVDQMIMQATVQMPALHPAARRMRF